MTRRLRNTLMVAGTYTAFLVAGLVLQFVVWGDRMPDPMASHFGGDGYADGFLSPLAFHAVFGAVLLGTGALFAAMAWLAGERGQRLTVGLGCGVAVQLWGVLLAVLVANLDAAQGDAVVLRWWVVAASLVAGVLLGALAWWLAGPDPQYGVGDRTVPRGSTLGEDEVAVWYRAIGSPMIGVAGGLTMGAALPLYLVGGWVAALTMILCGLLCVALAIVRVVVDRSGVTVTFAGLPWPRKRIALSEIVEASHREVSAMGEFGGWGYRVRPKASGVIMRSGEALSVTLPEGKEFVVTTKDAAGAAELLNALLERDRKTRP